jgi:DNA repair protein RecO (recombination protein O)
MTETLVECQPAFILQHRHYRETSVILDLFTRDYGIVGVLAKGVRKPKSRTAGLLQPFKALTVSYCGKAELKTLTQVELQPTPLNLTGLALYCGYYMNELISLFCHKHDPHPDVYADYAACLQQLANAVTLEDTAPFTPPLQLERVLRLFELNLMQHIGLALLTDHDALSETPIKATARYFFQADRGAVEHSEGPISGKTIQALQAKAFTDIQTLREAKKIMRRVIHFHLQGKPLKSRGILAKIFSQL